jgi:hypothetical protein
MAPAVMISWVMPDIIHLKNGLSPPQTEDCILVEKTPNGKYDISAVMAFSKRKVSFEGVKGVTGLDSARERAVDVAIAIGVTAVYIKGEPDAYGP